MGIQVSKHALAVLAVLVGTCCPTRWYPVSAHDQAEHGNPFRRTEDAVTCDNELAVTGLPPLATGFAADVFGAPRNCSGGYYPVAWYVGAEMLLFTNDRRGRVSQSASHTLPVLPHEWGARVTVGRKQEPSIGWEVAFIDLDWDVFREQTGGPLQPAFFADGVNLSAFQNADQQWQSFGTSFFSAEANRRWFDWDTMSAFVGIRYLDLDETLRFFSRSGPPSPDNEGFLQLHTRNRLVGPQAGLEMIHPLGPAGRWTVSAYLRGGVYANSARSETQLINADTVELNNAARKTGLAGSGEIGWRTRWKITPRVSVHAGYELWYFARLARIEGQTLSPLTPLTGGSRSDLNMRRETRFHGATFGGQFTW